jgi:hypothetical protein
MKTNTAILILRDLGEVDLQMINTTARSFEIDNNSKTDLLEKVTHKLIDTDCWPGLVFIKKQNVEYECDTIYLRACFIKGRLSEDKCAKFVFSPVNILEKTINNQNYEHKHKHSTAASYTSMD